MKIDRNLTRKLAAQASVTNGVSGGTVATQIDIKETPQGIIITLNSPSLTEDNYHLELGQNTLTLYTSYGESQTDDLGEPQRPTAARVFPTPPSVNQDEIDAVFDGNTLHIYLPFREDGQEEQRREIPIRSRHL